MKVEDLNRCSPLVFLGGAILSFADPVTDILTLVEFYRAGHKTWFGVGLVFIILPCLVFPIVFHNILHKELPQDSRTTQCMQVILCGLHPFSASFARLQGFVVWWRGPYGNEIESASNKRAVYLLFHLDYAVFFESVLESAPQFILQLYAVSVQEEPVEVIQIISLPVSFLSLTWAFTTTDGLIVRETHAFIGTLKKKKKLALVITHIFLLSSRLFAVCYFIVSYKWWVIAILLFHSFLIMTADNMSLCRIDKWSLISGPHSAFFCCVHWLRDGFSLQLFETSADKSIWRKMQVLSNVLFVIENVIMIVLFYLSQPSNTWYSLPVTVCVCVFSVIGSVMRVIVFHLLLKDQSDHAGA